MFKKFRRKKIRHNNYTKIIIKCIRKHYSLFIEKQSRINIFKFQKRKIK